MDTATSPNISRADILATIEAEIRRLSPDAPALTEATDISTELSLDSVAINELTFALEETFDVAIPLNALADVYTVGGLIDLVLTYRTGR